MRLPRFTTRRLMTTVAGVGFVLGGCRAFNLAMTARFHRDWAREHRSSAAVCRQRADAPGTPPEEVAGYRAMAEGYETAARWSDYWAAHPWLLPRPSPRPGFDETDARNARGDGPLDLK